MKYELNSLDMRHYDMGWFQNSKITLGRPPLGGKEHGPMTSRARPGWARLGTI
jgi:hypothetical protein